jgi:hypothetical protein
LRVLPLLWTSTLKVTWPLLRTMKVSVTWTVIAVRRSLVMTIWVSPRLIV